MKYPLSLTSVNNVYICFLSFLICDRISVVPCCSVSMPSGLICASCGCTFQRARGLRRHQCHPMAIAEQLPPHVSPGMTPPPISVDVPESATHRTVATQTVMESTDASSRSLPLDAVTPARRISRVRRQLIRPLLEEVITSTTDVAVGTDAALSDTHSTDYVFICTPQVSDMPPAPNHELPYVQETTRRMPDLIGRLCRCRTCIRHSWWARRRRSNQGTTAPRPPQLELVSLPPLTNSESSSEDRRRLRLLHHDFPLSVICICSCYACIGHRALDYAAQAVARQGRTSAPPPEGGGCRDPRPTR